MSHSSVEELATGVNTSHQDAVGLKGATLRAPIAIALLRIPDWPAPRAKSIADVHVQSEIEMGVDVEPFSSFGVGLGTQPTHLWLTSWILVTFPVFQTFPVSISPLLPI